MPPAPAGFSKLARSIFRPNTHSEIEEQARSWKQQSVTPANSQTENKCLFQAFEWHVPADQKHWRRLGCVLASLKELGVDELWLPPGCKATSQSSNGYDIYDLYDLGEFDQKWHKETKWGSVTDLISLSSTAQSLEIGLIWDAVLSHRAGGDHKERVNAVEVDAKDRNKIISKPKVIEAWLNFSFDGRGGKYSDLKLHAEHFNGVDYDAALKKQKEGVIYLTSRKGWSPNVATSEHGNYDFLMFSNLDYRSSEVRADTINWGADFMPKKLAALSGYRIDAARHIDWKFTAQFLAEIQKANPERKWTFLAEYWHGGHPSHIINYLRKFPRELGLMAYDAPLLYKFRDASQHLLAPLPPTTRIGKQPIKPADLRELLKDTLVSVVPGRAVTMVASHDTQPGQTSECIIPPAFKEASYAIVLLRAQGTPCIFYGDLYGVQSGGGQDAVPPLLKLLDLMLARKLFAYGTQREYWDAPGCIGWTREGLDPPMVPVEQSWKTCGCAIVISNEPTSGKKRMCVGKRHAGETWTDLWDWEKYKTRIDQDGFGVFCIGGVGVNVYVENVASGREKFGRFDRDIYGKV